MAEKFETVTDKYVQAAIPLFDGHYDHWEMRMENLLRSKDKADARLKIYSISTKYYFEFGVHVPEDVAKNLRGVPQVFRVIPDIYYAAGAKSYGGEPFINGVVVPYEDKYHNWFVRPNDPSKRIDPNSIVISPFWSMTLIWSKKIPGTWAYKICVKMYYKATLPKEISK